MDYSKDPALRPTIAERLNNVLELEAAPEAMVVAPVADTELVIGESPDKEMQDDYQKTREVLRSALDMGVELVSNANFFAREKQDARSVEAAAMAQKELRDTALALFGVHKTRKEIERLSVPASGDMKVTNNNAVFIGTTGDLLKLTKHMNKDGLLQQALEAIDVKPSDMEK